jgi:guanylate kinase
MRAVFLVPPSLEILKERMTSGRNLTETEKQRRLHSAGKELAIGLTTERYFCITTEEVHLSLPLVHKFFTKGEKDMEVDRKARDTARRIIQQLNKEPS